MLSLKWKYQYMSTKCMVFIAEKDIKKQTLFSPAKTKDTNRNFMYNYSFAR